MELEAWSGDWGLPSIDAECLKILAFAKFSGAPLTQVLLGCLLAPLSLELALALTYHPPEKHKQSILDTCRRLACAEACRGGPH